VKRGNYSREKGERAEQSTYGERKLIEGEGSGGLADSAKGGKRLHPTNLFLKKHRQERSEKWRGQLCTFLVSLERRIKIKENKISKLGRFKECFVPSSKKGKVTAKKAEGGVSTEGGKRSGGLAQDSDTPWGGTYFFGTTFCGQENTNQKGRKRGCRRQKSRSEAVDCGTNKEPKQHKGESEKKGEVKGLNKPTADWGAFSKKNASG